MAPRTLLDKIWDAHVVQRFDDGTCVLYIDRHLVHEVTSPQAYEGLEVAGRKPWRIESVVATADHNTPTKDWDKGIRDPVSRLQVETLDENMKKFGAKVYFPFLDRRQGIVHVIGPEQGATLPGMTVVCGDSHTSTHGAFGALAFGIGTSEGLARASNFSLTANVAGSAQRLAFAQPTLSSATALGSTIVTPGDNRRISSVASRPSFPGI